MPIKNAARQSFGIVPETCPYVDSALEDAAELIKKQTNALREAFVDALERAMNAEERVEELEDKVIDLQRELVDVRSQLES